MVGRHLKKFRTLLAMMLIFAAATKAMANTEIPDGTSNTEERPLSQRLDPITVVDKPIRLRPDLDPDSIKNLYRVETSARFGSEVFTERDIQKLNPVDINDLIDKATGINMTYQGRRSPYFFSQRGGGSFTYIIDGAILPPSTNRILYKIPVTAIELLQVVRGSTSLTLGPSIPIGASNSGSGLNTGFVIIRTKRPQLTQAVMTGSIEQTNGGHPVSSNVDLYAGTRLENASGVGGYLSTMISKMDRPSKADWFDGRSSEGGMANAGFQTGKFSLNLMAYHDEGRFEMQRGIDVDGVLSDARWYYDPLKTTVLSSDMAMQWTPDHATLVNLFQTRFEQTEYNESLTSPDTTIKNYTEETSGMGLRHNARLGNTLFQLGGQISNSTGYGPNTNKKYNRYDTTVTGWSASVEQRFVNGRLVFDGGYRQDTKHIDHSSTSATDNDVNNDVDMAPAKIFALGTHFQLTDTYCLDGRYYHGRQGTVGDFDMQLEDGSRPAPEEQKRVEVAVSADFVSFFRPTLTWFSIDADNAKSATDTTYEMDGATYYYYTESDELRNGLELMIQGKFGPDTRYKVSWTHMLENKSVSDGVPTDEIGASTPENLYALTVNHQWGAYSANFSIKQVDEWTMSRSPRALAQPGGLGGYTRIDANISRNFTIHKMLLAVTVFGRNLGDEHYATRYVTGYYPDRGRTIGAQVAIAF